MEPIPLPYPNRLQHRQRNPRNCRELSGTVDDSLPPHHNNDPSYLNEQLRRAQLLSERADMHKAAVKRRTLATEVVEASGVPLPTIPRPVKAGEPTIDIFHAACDGDPRMIEINLRAGVDVNTIGQPHPQQYDGVQFEQRWTFTATPIVFAAAFGRERCVHALLLNGADPLIPSSTGVTAKEYAWERNYRVIFDMLEEAERKAALQREGQK